MDAERAARSLEESRGDGDLHAHDFVIVYSSTFFYLRGGSRAGQEPAAEEGGGVGDGNLRHHHVGK